MENESRSNFIWDVIDKELEISPKKKIHTRFPPEPNGYLHIGHAKAININFTTAIKYNGQCNLRFDDTNPSKEDTEYVDSIQEDIKWLGFSWEDRVYYVSSYFEKIYEFACLLIQKGSAYVCDLSADEIREHRGTLTTPGIESPYRTRTIEENMDLFTRMKNGDFPDGERVLRAKIDMASPNMNMRDPVIYRIQRATHHITGDDWCIYPMYDFAHPLSDWIEGITYSLCSLEFEDHRPLYDWFLSELELPIPPRQIEFARLNVTYTLMSKRKLLQVVKEKLVDGWDDPRMPTLSGLRRRGYTPSSIRYFCDTIGVSKTNSTIDFAYLEHCIRAELNKSANRVMAILDPLEVELINYPDNKTDHFEVVNNPENAQEGSRLIPFTKNIYIEREDFMEDPPSKFFRLKPDSEVRLMSAYIVKCVSFDKDEKTGEITKVYCNIDPESTGGSAKDGRKIKGTIHWVSKEHAKKVIVNLYENLFLTEDPNEGDDICKNINPDSLKTLEAFAEPSLINASSGQRFQFIRNAYFCVDSKHSKENAPIFNRITSLKDSWLKANKGK